MGLKPCLSRSLAASIAHGSAGMILDIRVFESPLWTGRTPHFQTGFGPRPCRFRNSPTAARYSLRRDVSSALYNVIAAGGHLDYSSRWSCRFCPTPARRRPRRCVLLPDVQQGADARQHRQVRRVEWMTPHDNLTAGTQEFSVLPLRQHSTPTATTGPRSRSAAPKGTDQFALPSFARAADRRWPRTQRAAFPGRLLIGPKAFLLFFAVIVVGCFIARLACPPRQRPRNTGFHAGHG